MRSFPNSTKSQPGDTRPNLRLPAGEVERKRAALAFFSRILIVGFALGSLVDFVPLLAGNTGEWVLIGSSWAGVAVAGFAYFCARRANPSLGGWLLTTFSATSIGCADLLVGSSQPIPAAF